VSQSPDCLREQPQVLLAERLDKAVYRPLAKQCLGETKVVGHAEHLGSAGERKLASTRHTARGRSGPRFRPLTRNPAAAIAVIDSGKDHYAWRLLRLQGEDLLNQAQRLFAGPSVLREDAVSVPGGDGHGASGSGSKMRSFSICCISSKCLLMVYLSLSAGEIGVVLISFGSLAGAMRLSFKKASRLRAPFALIEGPH